MKPSQVSDAVSACLKAQQPLFIWGPAGVGKSSVVRQVSQDLGRNLIDLRLTLLDSPDLRGFPSMPSPLANRFTHIDYEVDLTDWRVQALKDGWMPEVINFINFRPGLLHDFDPDRRAFPTPRSWEFVSKIIENNTTNGDKIIERGLIAGSVGDGAAAEFISFLNIYRNLPDPDGVLAAPTKAPVPDDLATLYALCGALAARASEANFGRLVEYCDRLKPEFQVLTIRDAVTRTRALANTPEFGAWAVKNSSVLV